MTNVYNISHESHTSLIKLPISDVSPITKLSHLTKTLIYRAIALCPYTNINRKK